MMHDDVTADRNIGMLSLPLLIICRRYYIYTGSMYVWSCCNVCTAENVMQSTTQLESISAFIFFLRCTCVCVYYVLTVRQCTSILCANLRWVWPVGMHVCGCLAAELGGL